MYNIVFADDSGNLKNYVTKIAKNNNLKLYATSVFKTKTFGESVEVVFENDDRASWRELLSTFQVLTSGRLKLD